MPHTDKINELAELIHKQIITSFNANSQDEDEAHRDALFALAKARDRFGIEQTEEARLDMAEAETKAELTAEAVRALLVPVMNAVKEIHERQCSGFMEHAGIIAAAFFVACFQVFARYEFNCMSPEEIVKLANVNFGPLTTFPAFTSFAEVFDQANKVSFFRKPMANDKEALQCFSKEKN